MTYGSTRELQRPLSAVVVEAVAEEEGVEPVDLRDPLFDEINPDALDALFRNVTGHVVFEYHGYEVKVDSNGKVDVTPVGDA